MRILMLLIVSVAWGQTYDSVSIHTAAPGAQPTLLQTGNVTVAKAVTVKQLVHWAYRIGNRQLIMPVTIGEPKFDVRATGKTTLEQDHRLMMQHLLESRFKLKYTTEAKEFFVAKVEIAKDGLRMKDAQDSESWSKVDAAAKVYRFHGLSMADICAHLEIVLGAPAVDATSLAGRKFDGVIHIGDPAEGNPHLRIVAAYMGDLGLLVSKTKTQLPLMVVSNWVPQ
jgi:uncharacterized protein (TIGR03435 family)